MTGYKKSSAHILERRQKVLRYYLRGFGADEIARVKDIGGSRATIFRDIEELKVAISQKIDAAELWPIRRAVAMKEELIRETWRIYHLPPQQRVVGSGDKAQIVNVDPTFRQLTALGILAKLTDSLDHLAFGAKLEVTQTSRHEISADTLEKLKELPPDVRLTIAKALATIERPETGPSAS